MPFQFGVPIIKIGCWTRVPKVLLANLAAEKQRLTIANRAKIAAQKRGFDKEGPDFFELFKEDRHYLYVPRAYRPKLVKELLRDHDYLVHDTVSRRSQLPGVGTDLVTLGPHADQPLDQAPGFEALTAGNDAWPHGRQFGLRCGGGKTPVGIKAAHRRGGKFLWVTTSTLLLEDMLGTRKGIPRWLGIPREQICVVQGARCDWQGKSVGVAMLHSLALHDYGPDFYSHWDLVIFDEGDMLASGHFMDVAPRFPCERWLLSANLTRADGMEVLYQLHIGPVCYQHMEHELKPECYFVDFQADPKLLARVGWDVQRGERRVSYQLTAKNLMLNAPRTARIIDLVRRATEQQGRTVLVLGDSVDGLLNMSRLAREALPNRTHGLVVGKIPPGKRDQILQSNEIVWATSKLGYRGLDKPTFDTVIAVSLVAVNEQFWNQTVGRILRFVPNKPTPKVVIISDSTIGPLVGLTAKLARIFKKQGWKRVGDAPLHEAQKRRHEEMKHEQEFDD